jgi:drug/metabolite transporter (DMT)-like permease
MELWIILTLLSAIVFAIGDIFGKTILSKYHVEPKQLFFEQYLLSFVIVLVFLFPYIEFDLFYEYPFLFFGKAFFLGSSSLLYLTLLKKYEISLVSPLLNLSPVVLLFFSSFVLSESISIIQFMGILITILGTFLLEVTFSHHHKKKPHEHHFRELFKKPSRFFVLTILLLITISITAIFDRLILTSGVHVYTNMYFTSVLIMIISSIYFIKKNYFFQAITLTIKEPKTLIISAIKLVDTFLILTAIAIPSALVSLIIPLRRTSTLFSSLFGGLLFHEKHLVKKMFSVIIMIIGVMFIVM